MARNDIKWQGMARNDIVPKPTSLLGIVFDTYEGGGHFLCVWGTVFDTWEIAGVSAKTVKVVNGS